jgi:hypothetical protein
LGPLHLAGECRWQLRQSIHSYPGDTAAKVECQDALGAREQSFLIMIWTRYTARRQDHDRYAGQRLGGAIHGD